MLGHKNFLASHATSGAAHSTPKPRTRALAFNTAEGWSRDSRTRSPTSSARAVLSAARYPMPDMKRRCVTPCNCSHDSNWLSRSQASRGPVYGGASPAPSNVERFPGSAALSWAREHGQAMPYRGGSSLPFNQRVPGSSPSTPTIQSTETRRGRPARGKTHFRPVFRDREGGSCVSAHRSRLLEADRKLKLGDFSRL
jgi:hypothetical protein